MNQQIIDDLIGAPPPSTVDLEAVIGGQRRRQRVRRLVASGSAAAGVVLAVFLGIGVAGDPGPRQTPQPAATSTAPSPSPTGFALETGTKAGRERTLNRIQAAVETAFAEHAPGAKWIYMPDEPGEKRTPDGHPRMWVTERPVFFEARSGIAAHGDKGGFYLRVRPVACVQGQVCSPPVACDEVAPGCTEGRTPGGLTVMRWVSTPSSGKYVFHNVQVMLRGGTYSLTMIAVNTFGGDYGPPSAAAPPLTRTQLEKMAADVAERITG